MKNILLIVKKELKRFFTDRRMLASLLLPGLMIFILYTIMGNVIKNVNSVDSNYEYKVHVVDEPLCFNDLFTKLEIKHQVLENKSLDEMKQDIENEDADILVIYSGDFNNLSLENPNKPEIKIYYNSVRTESSELFTVLYSFYNTYESQFSNIIDINSGTENFDLASAKDVSGMLFSGMLPMLLIVFLFSAVMGIVPESIAGEKERGTIATLLVTPLKRTDLAIGKIVSLSLVSLCSAVSSFIGTILSLPMLVKGQGADIKIFYGFTDYVAIMFILITLILLFVGILSITSAFSKSVKESGSYATPIMVIVMVIAVLSMFSSKNISNVALYFIPVYNASLCLSEIFAFDANIIGIIITIFSNLFYALVCNYVLARMFNSEKIMFSK